MAMFVVAWAIVEYGKKQMRLEKEYDRVYIWIQLVIDDWRVNEQSYKYIMRLFDQLNSLKFKNKEKTSVLFTNFLLKYKTIANDTIQE
jgi:hypothetical protein